MRYRPWFGYRRYAFVGVYRHMITSTSMKARVVVLCFASAKKYDVHIVLKMTNNVQFN